MVCGPDAIAASSGALVIDGVMYVSTAWSMVKAYDAATGKLLWSTTRAARDRREAVDVVNGVAA